MANRELPDPGLVVEKHQSSSNESINSNFVFRGGQNHIHIGVQIVMEAPQNATAATVFISNGDENSYVGFQLKLLGTRGNGYLLTMSDGGGDDEVLAVVSESETETIIQLAKTDGNVTTTLESFSTFIGETSFAYLEYNFNSIGENFGSTPIPAGSRIAGVDEGTTPGTNATVGSAGDHLLVRGQGLYFALDDNSIYDANWSLLGGD